MRRYTSINSSSAMRNPRRATYNWTEMVNRRSGTFSNRRLRNLSIPEIPLSSSRWSGDFSVQENSSSSNHRSGNLSIHENPSSSEVKVLKPRKKPDNDRPQGMYEDRTIIIENIRADVSLENLHNYFSRYGRVCSLRKVNPHDPNLAGCSKDALLVRSKGCDFEGTTLGIYAIIEYFKPYEALYAVSRLFSNGTQMSELRWMMTSPYQKNGFRCGLRRIYTYIEPEMDEPTTQNMETGARDEPRNTNTRIERLTEEP